MASRAAKNVDDYLASLPEARRTVVGAVRNVVRRSLPAGCSEAMGYGMISYTIPLEDVPLPAIGELIARTTPEHFIARYEASRTAPRSAASSRRTTATKAAVAKTHATSAGRPAATRRANSTKRR